MDCFGCICQHCARNVDEVQYFTPGEVDEPCYNCDDHPSGKGQWKGICQYYVEPVKYREMKARIEEEKASTERRKLLIVRSFK